MNPHPDIAKERAGAAGDSQLLLAAVPRAVLVVCLFILCWLVVLHLRVANHANPGVTVLGQAFDMTRESTVPTCWAVLQALAVAFAAGAVASVLRKQGVKLSRRIAWMGASFLFAVIGMDDGAAIHERMGSVTSLQLMSDIGYPSYPWHVSVAPALGGGLLLVIVMIWRDLEWRGGTRGALLLAVACYGLSQGIDYVEGIERMSGLASNPMEKVLPGWMIVEEALEMAGTALFLFVFLSHLLRTIGSLQLVMAGNVLSFENGRTGVRKPVFNESP